MHESTQNAEIQKLVSSRVLAAGIASIVLVILGGVVWSGVPAEHLSPRATWQLRSLGFMLVCIGAAGITWLCGGVAAGRVLSESSYPKIYAVAEIFSTPRVGIPILVGFLFYMYWETLSFTFFGDDCRILSWIARGPLRMLLPIEGIYHYFPVTLLLIGIPQWLGFGDASTYHCANIIFHSANTILVFAIARELLDNRFEATLSAILFGLFFLAYNPVVWSLVGNHYVTSTFFALLAFLWFIRYRRTQSNGYLWAFALAYSISIYTHEICVPLVAACFLYDLSRKGRQLLASPLTTLRRMGGAYIVPVAMLAALWAIKYFFTPRIVISQNDPTKLLQNFITATCYFLPSNNMNAYWIFSKWGQNSLFLTCASLTIAAVAAAVFLKANRAQRLMLGWYVLFTLLPVLVAQVGPRYFYVAAVGWAVFWATVVTRTGTLLAGFIFRTTRGALPREPGRLLARSGATLLCICIALQGQRHAAHLIDVWRQGSDITNSVIESTVELVGRHPQTKTLIVVDQPTWYRADTFHGALLLTGSMRFAIDAMTDLEIPNVTSVRLTVENFFDAAHPQTSPEQLAAAAGEPETLVIVYDETMQRMVPYQFAAKSNR